MKKGLKKRLTMALAAIMASSSICVTSYGATYTDIDDVPWAGASAIIESVSDLGLISGYEDNTFRANNDVTYLEVMQMIYNVLVKTGSSQTMDILDQATYTYVLEAYQVPSWAQKATAYCLHTNAITTGDLGVFMTNGVSNAASRGDVAEILGNALVSKYSFDRNASAANSYADYYKISSDQLEQIDLVTRLGIFSGNDNNYFMPDNNINRAEMAVVLNKTYSVLAENGANNGEILSISTDGSWYDIKVEFDYGETTVISLIAGATNVYGDPDGTSTISVARLAVGDRIGVYYSGYAISEIRMLDGTISTSSASSLDYDITGNVTEIDDYVVTYENTNTGEEEEVELRASCIYYLEGEIVDYSTLEEAVSDMDDTYAFAGMNLYYVWDKDDEDTEVDVYISEIHVELTDEYIRTGKVTKMTDSYIQILWVDGVSTSNLYFASGCDFYFEGEEIDDDEAQKLVDNAGFYVELVCDSSKKVEEVNLTEDPTPGFGLDFETYKISKFSSESDKGGSDIIVVYEGDDKVGYPYTDDTNFYIYDYATKDWSNESATEAKGVYEDDNEGDFDGSAYARMVYNVYGELIAVYIAPTSSMFKYTMTAMLETYGEVTDYDKTDGFTTEYSKYTYTMMSSYNVSVSAPEDTTAYTGNDPNSSSSKAYVKYPLNIPATTVSSLSVFQNIMANLDDLTVEFDVVATTDGVVQGLDVYLVEAEGTFISYDEDDKIMTIELSDGYEMKLDVSSKPDVEAEDDEDFELSDLTAYKYKGTEVTLEFDDGVLETIYIGDSSTSSTIKGVAVYSEDGLKLEGSSTVYEWSSSNNTTVTNKSMTSTTLATIQTAIEDPDIEVYVEVKLNINSGKVTTITAYVLEAEGELDDYDEDKGTARIITDDGNKFTFEFAAGYDIYIDGEEEDDERTINNTLEGETVTFEFNDNGKADAMYGKT